MGDLRKDFEKALPLAQKIYQKLVGSTKDVEFIDIIEEALGQTPMEEKLTVCLLTPHVAKIMMSYELMQRNEGMTFEQAQMVLFGQNGASARYLVEQSAEDISRIIQKPVDEVRKVLETIGFRVENGLIGPKKAEPEPQVRGSSGPRI